ncbi:hypothetical protein [Miniimonas arenae]|uniref:hypothetical protein n=1 Tax=Miniimonas arenae TaxID=676201 RepID=UPI0015D58151|nr:hypothetical protein [Miniimonas arenae]
MVLVVVVDPVVLVLVLVLVVVVDPVVLVVLSGESCGCRATLRVGTARTSRPAEPAGPGVSP